VGAGRITRDSPPHARAGADDGIGAQVHEVVCDLFGKPMLPLRVDRYVTFLDLGLWGAVYKQGWDRRVMVSGKDAKTIKRTINCVRIYPPRSRNRREILEWAAPSVQTPPIGLSDKNAEQSGNPGVMPLSRIKTVRIGQQESTS